MEIQEQTIPRLVHAAGEHFGNRHVIEDGEARRLVDLEAEGHGAEADA